MSWTLVAFTWHVDPASPGVKVEPDSVHVPRTTCQVTAPVPDPPDVVNAYFCPYVAATEVTVRTDYAARVIVTVVSEESTAL